MDDVDAADLAAARYGVGLVFRYPFGKPTSPTLKFSARYNKLTFSIDESARPKR